ncbi:hypothetical protein HRR83_002561 [Exophiala dermatitidis]|uniref:Uncharacterized protein n=1 Tax=Exophiala dermatitidis TaxID=5970 RepID=A0AAN6EW79_EXODE|nr:hypothetical protein HRR73_005502 [Exophiala dermatitidis]KAJ4523759.1 hypothetical protein HRR74_001952 [Exophiala dermatitidis]KAJ4537304.1 hypothetical protein HRR76_005315 [Exophiala dermatitidis]KAJ4555100.1 hypothetical protein HRR77_001043 [Exophiala dermatitidis]KAJ4566279.1 hypothetical protein HRR79_005290 [Exophiala dermatitidis]
MSAIASLVVSVAQGYALHGVKRILSPGATFVHLPSLKQHTPSQHAHHQTIMSLPLIVKVIQLAIWFEKGGGNVVGKLSVHPSGPVAFPLLSFPWSNKFVD